MNPKIKAVLVFPWRMMKAFGRGVKRGVSSARFWVLFILAIIVLLVAYYALVNRYAPITTDAYFQAFVVQVAPQVDGQVVRVHVTENQQVEKDMLLFEIDPRPYQQKVQELEGTLARGIQDIAQMQSELKAAQAEEARVAALESYTQAVHEQEARIFKDDATTERKFINARQQHLAAKALVEKTKAVVRQKEQALEAKVGDEYARVAEARAQLATAKLHLEWTKVRAPARGYVTNLQLRVGSYAHAGQPLLTCIETDSWWIVANFRESTLENIRPGQPAGIACKTYPGRIFSGTVQSIGWGVDEGQGIPSGKLPQVKKPQELLPSAQRFQVRVVLDKPDEVALRVGATAAVTVYTDPDFVLNPLAEFWQRIESWLYYLR
ncbi:MAG TPA: HlyD family secretion protein [Gemmataceae bacterium]|nr:HlyD family secretion protein [Gemmataceae bacterium]